MTRELLLVRTLVDMADTLVDDFDIIELLSLLADRCVEVLDVAAAGLMLVGPDEELRVMASSSEAMRVLELFELQSQEGPCPDCYHTGQPVVAADLAAAEERWPRFAVEARAADFQSVHALPMRLRGTVIGALNLFHHTTGEMDEADIAAAQALADVATIGILQYRAGQESQVVVGQLQAALHSRVVIEQAKGMVAERAGLSMEESFAGMRGHARRHNLRLGDVARRVIAGALPIGDLEPRSGRPVLAVVGDGPTSPSDIGSEVTSRVEEVQAIHTRALHRDVEAEKRDASARQRDEDADERADASLSMERADRHAAEIDRLAAGMDRDSSAEDRHDLTDE